MSLQEWFQNKIRQEGIEDKFKLPASKQAFSKFCRINAELFNYLKYQELNHKALHKILKSRYNLVLQPRVCWAIKLTNRPRV